MSTRPSLPDDHHALVRLDVTDLDGHRLESRFVSGPARRSLTGADADGRPVDTPLLAAERELRARHGRCYLFRNWLAVE